MLLDGFLAPGVDRKDLLGKDVKGAFLLLVKLLLLVRRALSSYILLWLRLVLSFIRCTVLDFSGGV